VSPHRIGDILGFAGTELLSVLATCNQELDRESIRRSCLLSLLSRADLRCLRADRSSLRLIAGHLARATHRRSFENRVARLLGSRGVRLLPDKLDAAEIGDWTWLEDRIRSWVPDASTRVDPRRPIERSKPYFFAFLIRKVYRSPDHLRTERRERLVQYLAHIDNRRTLTVLRKGESSTSPTAQFQRSASSALNRSDLLVGTRRKNDYKHDGLSL